MFFEYETDVVPGIKQMVQVEVDTSSDEFESLVRKLIKRAEKSPRRRATAGGGAIVVTLRGAPYVDPRQTLFKYHEDNPQTEIEA